MSLDDIRQKINEIDAALLPLFLDRLDCARAVAAYKKAHQLPVLNRDREEAILAEMAKQAGRDEAAVRAFYEGLFAISRGLQEDLLAEDRPC